MPYVEGFGTWPFGEEWLWEAIAGCYLPLLELLEAGAPLTLSLTPVLCDQLEAAGRRRALRALHRGGAPRHPRGEDARRAARGRRRGARGASSSARGGDYEQRAASARRAAAAISWGRSRRTRAGPPRPRTRCCRCWPPTRACALQVRTGVALPPRAASAAAGAAASGCRSARYAPWLEPLLDDAGVQRDLRRADRAAGARRARAPAAAGERGGLCSRRSTARRSRWSGATTATRPPAPTATTTTTRSTTTRRGATTAARTTTRGRWRWRASTRATSSRARARLADAGRAAGRRPGVCALDTELLGHWWYEGVAWLAAVIEESARQGLELVRLDDAIERVRAGAVGRERGRGRRCEQLGHDGDLSTWSGPAVADWRSRRVRRSWRCCAAGERAGRRRCASCSRCRRATGLSWSRGRSPGGMRASASTGTGRRSRRRCRGRGGLGGGRAQPRRADAARRPAGALSVLPAHRARGLAHADHAARARRRRRRSRVRAWSRPSWCRRRCSRRRRRRAAGRRRSRSRRCGPTRTSRL